MTIPTPRTPAGGVPHVVEDGPHEDRERHVGNTLPEPVLVTARGDQLQDDVGGSEDYLLEFDRPVTDEDDLPALDGQGENP